MNSHRTQTLSAPPSLIASLKAGFDAITNHIALILFPIGLDLLLWFGPHFKLSRLVEALERQAELLFNGQDPTFDQLLQANRELWALAAERINLLAALRSYPVGIPSLMASILPVSNPVGAPPVLEVASALGVGIIWIVATLIGLAVGALYFGVVAQAALTNQINWREVWRDWPKASLQVILLALFWTGLLIAVSIPGSCVISLAALGGLTLAQCALLLYLGVLLWIFFPLVFSPHGIFVSGQKMFHSVKTAVVLTRYTLPNTSLFLLAVILLSKGLDMLWQVPGETSWLALVGVAGHAFVTTGLLAASFIYYRDANRWVQQMVERMRLSAQLVRNPSNQDDHTPQV
jgi:hypothetical protein